MTALRCFTVAHAAWPRARPPAPPLRPAAQSARPAGRPPAPPPRPDAAKGACHSSWARRRRGGGAAGALQADLAQPLGAATDQADKREAVLRGARQVDAVLLACGVPPAQDGAVLCLERASGARRAVVQRAVGGASVPRPWARAGERRAQQLLRAGGLGALAPRAAEAGPTYEMLLALDANNPRRGVRRSVLDKLGSVRRPRAHPLACNARQSVELNVALRWPLQRGIVC